MKCDLDQFYVSKKQLSLKYNINHMIGYSELLLEKIDSFEIDSISNMLNEYESMVELSLIHI